MTSFLTRAKKFTAAFLAVQLLLAMFPTITAAASLAGPNNGSTFASLFGYGPDWTSPTNAQTTDGLYSQTIIPKNSSSQYSDTLHSTGFGFAIPETATINGIMIDMKIKKSTTGSIKGYISQLVKNNTRVGINKEAGGYNGPDWPTTDTIKTYGTETDLWNTTWTPADINNPNFGFDLGVINTRQTTSAATAFVDNISIKVFYTAVTDTTPPVIGPHDNVVAEATSASGANVSYAAPVATDNFDANVNVACSPASGSLFPIGTTTVTCNASDVAGNTAVPTTFNATVQDTTAPVIALNGLDYVVVPFGSTYTEEGASWTDAVDGTGTAAVGGDVVNPLVTGTYMVTYNYTDTHGNVAAEVTRAVDVLDMTNPVVTLNGSDVINLEVGAPYVEMGATWTDNADGAGEIMTPSGFVDTNTVGTYTLVYAYADNSGNYDEKIRTVNVKDTTKPIIELIGAMIVDQEVFAPYVDLGATATDNYDGNISDAIAVINSVIINRVGTYTVTFNVTDANGNAADEVVRNVNILDRTKPVITLVGEANINIAVGDVYTDAGATATDNYDGDITSQIVIDNKVDTSKPGDYLVTYNVTDASGNAATAVTRNVSVADMEKPVINLNGSADLDVEFGDPYIEQGATWTDVVDGSGNATVSGDVVNTNALGTYVVKYNYTDNAGNAATEVTRTIRVVDTTIPVISLVGQNEVTISLNQIYNEQGANWVDNYDGTGAVTDIINNIVPDSVGHYQVYYNFTDSNGNAATQLTRTVHVVDNEKPIITLIGDMIMNHEVNTTFNDPGATATDNYDGDLTGTINVINSLVTGELGTYSITYDVTDLSGNKADQVTRTVKVIDTTKPVLTLVGEANVNIAVGDVYTDAGATAMDNYDGDITSQIVIDNKVDTTKPGNYLVTYNVSDVAGNAATAVTRNVTVVDAGAPVIKLNGPAEMNLEFGDPYVEQGATWEDGVDGSGSATISGDTVNPNALGTYVVKYNYTDNAGNAATEVTRTVRVVDTTAPELALVGNTDVTLEVFSAFNDQGATAMDGCDGNITSRIVKVGSVDVSKLGNYNLKYDVTDLQGNLAASVTRTVHIVDTTKPVITLKVNGEVGLVSNIKLGTNFVDPGATATDNYDGDLSGKISTSSNLDTSKVGSYAISYSVTDAQGNSSTATRLVNVLPNPVVDVIDVVTPVIPAVILTPIQTVGSRLISRAVTSFRTGSNSLGSSFTSEGNELPGEVLASQDETAQTGETKDDNEFGKNVTQENDKPEENNNAAWFWTALLLLGLGGAIYVLSRRRMDS